MQTALRQLLSDFLSAIVFLVVFGLGGEIYLATGAAVATGAAQFAFLKLKRRPVDIMQWLALGLVVVLGAATLITEDSRFIMAKPSFIHAAIGLVMLRRGWMMRYLPAIARDNLPPRVMIVAGYAWAALMIGLAAINLLVATLLPFHVWAWFITVGAVGAKVAAFLVQYVVFRRIVRRRLSQAAPAALPAA